MYFISYVCIERVRLNSIEKRDCLGGIISIVTSVYEISSLIPRSGNFPEAVPIQSLLLLYVIVPVS